MASSYLLSIFCLDITQGRMNVGPLMWLELTCENLLVYFANYYTTRDARMVRSFLTATGFAKWFTSNSPIKLDWFYIVVIGYHNVS